ncbi:MAG: (Fe-S)-binding protein [Dehalococcoidia bacterium]
MNPISIPAPWASGFSQEDTPDYEILNTCVQCGLCLPTCPTYRETYREQSSPRGRLHLMRSVYEGQLDVLDPAFATQMSECLDCRACEAVCPSGVQYGKVLEASRAQVEQAREQRGMRSRPERLVRSFVFGWLFKRLSRLRLVGGTARIYQQCGLQRLTRSTGLLRALRLEYLEQQLPGLSNSFFVPHGQVYPAVGERRGRVGLLAGCIMHVAYAGIDRATVRVLRQNGWEVVVPRAQGCCGALHAHAGAIDQGRELMRRNIAVFESADVELVVNNSAGCGAAMKEYGHLLHADQVWAERAATFSAGVRDITELLATSPLRGKLGRIDATVTYQEPCHLAHAQRIAAAPRTLLAAIPGLKLVEMAEASLCCGSAGIYSIIQPQMSADLRDRKLSHALATEAQIIATANPGCMLQLRAGLQASSEFRVPKSESMGPANRDPDHDSVGQQRSMVQVRHIVELLDESYRRGCTS